MEKTVSPFTTLYQPMRSRQQEMRVIHVTSDNRLSEAYALLPIPPTTVEMNEENSARSGQQRQTPGNMGR